MKASRSLSRIFALRALIALAFVTPIAWVYANSGAITNNITGRVPMRHYFQGPGGGAAQIAVNGGYYMILNLTYAGQPLIAKDWKIDQGPRRTAFGGFTTTPLDWFQTLTARVDVYRERTNEKVGTYNWSAKLANEPGVGFSYRCNVPGDRSWAADINMTFVYEKGTDPAAPHVNVYVR